MRKVMSLMLFLCLMAVVGNRAAFAQTTWSHAYGGALLDEARSIQQTGDGGYIVAGWTQSFGAGFRDSWVLKLDGGGEMDPSCTFISDTFVSPIDSSATVTDTAVTGPSTSAAISDTSVIGIPSPGVDTLLCTSPLVVNNPPDCGGAYPSLSEVWPPNHQMVGVNILGVTDPDGDPITITGITQDEPVPGTGTGTGSGNTCPDGGGVGTSTAQVRAERAGTPRLPGNGRVYKISFTASDGQGGECTGAVEVCVQHDQRPGNVCIDDGQVYNSTTCP